ncbi:MAG: hypothetical protein H6Q70_3329 [Firmicutes bacterium]|nr:hypothetical protein [Bacillota bacterium]
MRRVERIWLGRMLKGILCFLIFILIGTSVVEMQLDELTLNHENVIQKQVIAVYQQMNTTADHLEEEVRLYYTDWIIDIGDYFKAIL